MNRHIIQLFSFLALISFSSLAFSTFAFAENSCGDASTNLINCDVGGTGMIYTIVNTIINILTASVGVIATIGIIWCGFLILTAKDDQSRVATAKKRLLEIVVGITVWGLFWVLLELFIPGGALSTTLASGVDSIEVSTTSDTTYVGESSALSVTVSPDNASDKTYSITSDDTNIATVTHNSVLCMKTGSTTINVISSNGKTSSTTVTCTQKPKETTVGNSGSSSNNQVGTTPITTTSGTKYYNDIPYLLNVPDGATNNMPIIVFLHGSGENGDPNSVLNDYQVQQIFNRSDFISIAPIAFSREQLFSNIPTYKALIDQAISDTQANPNRVYIMGYSQGARAALKMIRNYTTFFKAAVIVSNWDWDMGGYSTGDEYISVPIRMYAGGIYDTYGEPDQMKNLMNKIKNAGGNITFQQFNDADHGSIRYYLPYDDIFNWFLQH